MTKARLDGLYMLLLGSVVFVLLGFGLERTAPARLVDFRMMYYPARCLIQRCDPYRESEVMRAYQTAGVDRSSDTETVRQVVTRYVYLPSAFCFTAPFALLPWGPAHVLWMLFTIGSLVFGSYLIWNLGADYAPIVSGVLAGFLLANSEVLVITGTAAGIALSLCMVAVWCFLRNRFVGVGMLCLAFSLAIKPQDVALVWLYFLLAGGANRQRALQTLYGMVLLTLPVVVWVWCVAPHWVQELRSNMSMFFAHGGINDPSPASAGAHGLGMVISLQAIISSFWDDPRIYNTASYILFAPLFLIWVFTTARARPSTERTLLALAAIAPLTMLPVYHRQYDAKLLLLTIPACAMIWGKCGVIRKFALLLNVIGFLLTGDLPWAMLLGLISHVHVSSTGLSAHLLVAVQVFPVPLVLLAMSVFYLWVYVRRCSAHDLPEAVPGRTELPRT